MRASVLLLFMLLVAHRSTRACESLARVDIEEETPYPSPSFLDVAETLAQSGYPGTGTVARETVFLLDRDRSRPWALSPRGGLVLEGRLDREALCGRGSEDTVVKRCCGGRCCRYLAIGWPGSATAGRTAYVRINIRDRNDNAPTFPGGRNSGPGLLPSVTVRVHENVDIGWTAALPRAQDTDGEEFGVRKYELQGDPRCRDCFQVQIDKRSKGPLLKTRSRLDREKLVSISSNGHRRQQQHQSVAGLHLRLLAIDGGGKGPHNTGTLAVTVLLEDVNDNAPKFEQTSVLLTVPENGRGGRDLRSLAVTDADSGSNARLEFELVDFSGEVDNYFGLFPTGDRKGVTLRLQQPLDFERQKRFEFQILARDGGSPSLSATTTVTVQVTNVNDEPPQIRLYPAHSSPNSPPPSSSSNRVAMVTRPENGPKHDTLLLLHVTDPDSNIADINCEVTSPSNSPSFYLKDMESTDLIEQRRQFALRNSISLDRESQTSHRVVVLCADEAPGSSMRLTATAQVQLMVTDINDNSPAFAASLYVGQVRESDSTIPAIIVIRDGPILVSDADEGRNGRVRFELKYEPEATATGNNSSSSNSIDVTAPAFTVLSDRPEIRTSGPLDFETRREYAMLLVATDGGPTPLSSSVRLVISVLDINDNAPTFEERFYSFTVLEEQPAGTEVGRVRASDADTEPSNKDLLFEMTPLNEGVFDPVLNPIRLFAIENQTGRILTRVSIDHEKVHHSSFMVRVRNTNKLVTGRNNYGVRESYVSSVMVTVKVKDINDNAPRLKLRQGASSSDDSSSNRRSKPIKFVLHRSDSRKKSPKKEPQPSSDSSSCTVFPFTFVDDDEGPHATVNVTLRKNNNFWLDVDHSLLCASTPARLATGFYTIYVVGEDCSSGCVNASRRRTEQLLHVQVSFAEDPNRPDRRFRGKSQGRSNDKRFRNPSASKNPSVSRGSGNEDYSSDNASGVDQKTVLIFTVLIATIIVFCILLGLVIVKSRACLATTPQNTTVRKVDEPQSRHNSQSGSTKNYRNLSIEHSTENKRLWNNYDVNSLGQQQQQPAEFSTSTVMLYQRPVLLEGGQHHRVTDSGVSLSLSCDQLAVTDNVANSYEQMRSATAAPWTTEPHHQPHQQQQKHQQQHQQQHFYNYLMEAPNTTSQHKPPTNPSKEGLDTKPVTAATTTFIPNDPNNTPQPPNQKSINDVYLQTSFV